MESLNEMVAKAKMRASVLSSLDNKYAAISASQAAAVAAGKAMMTHGNGRSAVVSRKRKLMPSPSPSPGGIGINSTGRGENKDMMVEQLQEILNNRSEKMKNKITEQLVGKSLVLEINKPSKTRAMRIKKSMKTRQQVSNRELKKKQKLSSATLLSSSESVSLEFVSLLQHSWMDYAKNASRNCKTTAQIQTRMLSLNLIGASFLCLQQNNQIFFPRQPPPAPANSPPASPPPASTSTVSNDSRDRDSNDSQEWGTVIAETTNCLFVAYPSSSPSAPSSFSSPLPNAKSNMEPSGVVEEASPRKIKFVIRRFIKEACVFAITSAEMVTSLSSNGNSTAATDATPGRAPGRGVAVSLAAAFPVCVVHGKQHLPHLLHNHSSRAFSEPRD